MRFAFNKIWEHDVDLLIIEEFVSDKGFAKLFLDKIGLTDEYTLVEVMHSYADVDGESDITIILQYGNKRVGLLIEDKIDAPTMPCQSERYKVRAESARKRGEYEEYWIMLAAPEEYHCEHLDDPNAAYEYRITYEEMLCYLNTRCGLRNEFTCAVIQTALHEKKAGYQKQENAAVTDFWMKLRKFCHERYPGLDMAGTDEAKGSKSLWPNFRTALGGGIKVYYKSDRGCIDLEFPGYGDRIGELTSILGPHMTEQMNLWKTGKAASVRLTDESWKIDFNQSFELVTTQITEVLEAVSALCDLAARLNRTELC